jgi:hypothetical protein
MASTPASCRIYGLWPRACLHDYAFYAYYTYYTYTTSCQIPSPNVTQFTSLLKGSIFDLVYFRQEFDRQIYHEQLKILARYTTPTDFSKLLGYIVRRLFLSSQVQLGWVSSTGIVAASWLFQRMKSGEESLVEYSFGLFK